MAIKLDPSILSEETAVYKKRAKALPRSTHKYCPTCGQAMVFKDLSRKNRGLLYREKVDKLVERIYMHKVTKQQIADLSGISRNTLFNIRTKQCNFVRKETAARLVRTLKELES